MSDLFEENVMLPRRPLPSRAIYFAPAHPSISRVASEAAAISVSTALSCEPLDSVGSNTGVGDVVTYLGCTWQAVCWLILMCEFVAQANFFVVYRREYATLAAVITVFYASPILLVRHRIQKRARAWLQLGHGIGALIGFLPAILTSMSPWWRCLTLGAGFSLGWLAHYTQWASIPPQKARIQHIQYWGFMTGLLALFVIRFTFYSVNPLWACRAGAAVSVCLALLVSGLQWRVGHCRFISESSNTVLLSRSMLHESFISSDQYASASTESSLNSSPKSGSMARPVQLSPVYIAVASGCCLGASLFVFHLLFTGHSNVARWAGVDPFPSSLLVLACLFLGSTIGASAVMHQALTIVITISGVVLFSIAALSPRAVLAGGCIMAVTTPIYFARSLLDLRARYSGISAVCTVFTLLLLLMIDYMTFAYEYAEIWLQTLPWMTLYLAAAAFGAGIGPARMLPMGKNCAASKAALPLPWMFVFMFCVTAIGVMPSTLLRIQGVILAHSAAPIMPLQPPVALEHNRSEKARRGIVTIVEADMMKGYSPTGRSNMPAMRDWLTSGDSQPDIVGLLQTDTIRLWTGSVDLVEYFSYSLQMKAVAGLRRMQRPGSSTILTSLDIINSSVVYLPTSIESAPDLMTSAQVQVISGTSLHPLQVYCVRMSSSLEDRANQAIRAAESIDRVNSAVPIIFVGEFHVDVSGPELAPLNSRLNLLPNLLCSDNCTASRKSLESNRSPTIMQYFRNMSPNATVLGPADLTLQRPVFSQYLIGTDVYD